MPALYAGLGIFLPLITTNCAVMGVCLINIKEEYTFMQALVASFSYAVGFGLALILFAGVREKILLGRVPKAPSGYFHCSCYSRHSLFDVFCIPREWSDQARGWYFGRVFKYFD